MRIISFIGKTRYITIRYTGTQFRERTDMWLYVRQSGEVETDQKSIWRKTGITSAMPANPREMSTA